MLIPRISLLTITTFGLGAFIAVAVGVTLYMSGTAGVRSAQSLLAERAEVLLNNLERSVDSRLKPVSDQAQWTAHMIAMGRVNLDDLKALDAFMYGALGTTPQVRNLVLVRPDATARRWLRSERDPIETDFSGRARITETLERARNESESRWLPPIRSVTTRRAVLVHSTPLKVADSFVGVLIQVVPVFRLSDDMAIMGRESDVTPFILYGKDRVLAHPSLAEDDMQNVDHPLFDIAGLGDKVLARFYSPDSTSPFGMRALVGAKAEAVRVDGVQYVFVFRELERFGPENLTIGAYANVDSSENDWSMRSVMRPVIAGLAVLVSAVVFAAFAGRRLSQPVRVLARAADTARAGRLDDIPLLPRSAITEFDQAASAFNSMVDGLRERTLIRDTLGRFVSEEVARGLLSGKGELEPMEAKATALLCDLEGFTGLTDTLGSHRVVEFLNAYFDVMSQIIERYGGVITQFQGDAVLAVFNVPIPDRDHAAHALAAAIEMIRATDEQEFAGMRVRNRIGISTGRLLAGAVGSRGRMTYTVHGNTVNLASRIEELNKVYGTRILLNGRTAERCEKFQLRKVDAVTVRGYSDVVELYTPADL